MKMHASLQIIFEQLPNNGALINIFYRCWKLS